MYTLAHNEIINTISTLAPRDFTKADHDALIAKVRKVMGVDSARLIANAITVEAGQYFFEKNDDQNMLRLWKRVLRCEEAQG
jgi:hypothetical protein